MTPNSFCYVAGSKTGDTSRPQGNETDNATLVIIHVSASHWEAFKVARNKASEDAQKGEMDSVRRDEGRATG